MSSDLPLRDGHVWRPVHETRGTIDEKSANGQWSLPMLAIMLSCGLFALWFLVSGRHSLAEYKEQMHRLEMRRRHGIPDSDKRPFSIAYRDVCVKKAQEEEERIRLEEEEREKAKANAKASEALQKQNDPIHNKENVWPPTELRYSTINPSGTNRNMAPSPSYFSSPHVHFITPAFSASHTERSDSVATPDGQGNQSSPQDFAPPGALPFNTAANVKSPEFGRAPLSDFFPPSVSGKKRSASSSHDDPNSFGYSRRTKKSRASVQSNSQDQTNMSYSPEEDMNGMDDEELHNGKSFPRSNGDSATTEHFTRGMKRNWEQESEAGEEGNRTRIPDKQKRRLDSRRPDSLNYRGKKRDRSDMSSVLGDSEFDSRPSRKRGKLQGGSDDMDALGGIEESDEIDAIDEDDEDEDEDEIPISTDPLCQGRRVGEEWEVNGQRFKVALDGTRLRHTLVRRTRRKANMPRDSVHPDAMALIHVTVEVWMTEEEYKEARDRQELAWQDGGLTAWHNGAPSPLGSAVFPPSEGKTLFWPTSSPGSPSLRQLHSAPTTPNPFYSNRSVASSRRVPFSPSTLNSPSLAKSRSAQMHNTHTSSKWEKQDIEAAALARLRQAKQPVVEPKAAPVEQPPKPTTLPQSAPPSQPTMTETKNMTSTPSFIPTSSTAEKPTPSFNSGAAPDFFKRTLPTFQPPLNGAQTTEKTTTQPSAPKVAASSVTQTGNPPTFFTTPGPTSNTSSTPSVASSSSAKNLGAAPPLGQEAKTIPSPPPAANPFGSAPPNPTPSIFNFSSATPFSTPGPQTSAPSLEKPAASNRPIFSGFGTSIPSLSKESTFLKPAASSKEAPLFGASSNPFGTMSGSASGLSSTPAASAASSTPAHSVPLFGIPSKPLGETSATTPAAPAAPTTTPATAFAPMAPPAAANIGATGGASTTSQSAFGNISSSSPFSFSNKPTPVVPTPTPPTSTQDQNQDGSISVESEAEKPHSSSSTTATVPGGLFGRAVKSLPGSKGPVAAKPSFSFNFGGQSNDTSSAAPAPPVADAFKPPLPSAFSFSFPTSSNPASNSTPSPFTFPSNKEPEKSS